MIKDNPILNAPSLILLDTNIQKYLDAKAQLWVKSGLSKANTAEQIGVMSGYDLIETTKNCGGYCAMGNKEIAIVEFKIEVVLHELCHAFQSDMNYWHKLEYTLSDLFKGEQQCESMAKYLYQKIYHKTGDDLFTAYFDKKSLDFLRNWYKDSIVQIDI
jgi:hypothetical protein